jgi:hypothetical protein
MSFSLRNQNLFSFSDLTQNLKYLQPVAVGWKSGKTQQYYRTIILNASGEALPSIEDQSLYISPVRGPQTSAFSLFYNTTSKEITYGPSTGGGSNLPIGSLWSDYLFWNNLTTSWEVGSEQFHLGANSGQFNQGSFAVALGYQAGQNNQQSSSVAIGLNAGQTNQKFGAVAIGTNAGQNNQQSGAVAIGINTGQTNQQFGAVAVGLNAGENNQGAYSVAIGTNAGITNQHANTIILNASGGVLNSGSSNALYIRPIRNITGPQSLFYNPSNSEISYSDPTFTNVSLQTYTYAYFQAKDAVIGKMMFTDCADKDAFYRLRISNPQTLFDGSTIYNSGPLLYDNDISSVNASISGPVGAAMTLSVNASAGLNVYAARQTHFYAHYQPGKSFLSLFSFCFGPIVAGITKRVGMYDVDNANSNQPLNGVLFEQTDTGVYRWMIYKGDGSTQIANQSSWNVDPLNGSGASGLNLNFTQNLLGFVDLEWLGVGRVRVGFYINGVPVICQAFNNTNFTTPYINNPLLPIRYEIRKTLAVVSSDSMTAVCCTIISEGGFQPVGIVRAIKSPTLQLSGVSPAITSIGSCIGLRLKSSCPRAILEPISIEITSNLNGNAVSFYSVYLWRPSISSTPNGLIWTSASNESLVEYNTTLGGIPYTTDLYNQMLADTAGISIQIEQGTLSSVTKSNFSNVISSLLIAQSGVDKLNRDIIMVVVDHNTAGPTRKNYNAIMIWREY